MSITFQCEHCGNQLTVDESLAGKHGHCKHCGHEMNVPSSAFRLEPLQMAGTDGPGPGHRSGAAAAKTSASKPRKEEVKLAPIEEPKRARKKSEDDQDDGKPYEFDKEFVPPRSAVPSSSPPVLMEARTGWRRMVRSLLKQLAKLEDAIYMALMVFWLIGAVAFLFELKPLAWSMLAPLVVCSVLLLMLGGFEVFAFPFKESLRHGLAFVFIPPYTIYYIATRWKKIKRPFRNAIGALLPLILLLGLAWFARPIRDWYLHAPPRKDATSTSTSMSRHATESA
jgi:hypothetical protein